MEFTLAEVLKDENNGKEFRHTENGCKVKNVSGCLFFAEMIELIEDKKNSDSILHLKETGKINWAEAPASSFWINGRYKAWD